MKMRKDGENPVKEQIKRINQSLIELKGTERLLIEHHRGILSYGTQEILAGTSFGRVRVQGENLHLCCMSREQLFIVGTIQGVILEREGK